MTVIIESIESWDARSGPSDKTKFIAASTGSIQTVETRLRFQTYITPETVSTTESKFFIQSLASSTNTNELEDDRTVYTSKSGGWGDGFIAGATFVIINTASSNRTGTILEVSQDGQTIITDQVFASLENFPVGAVVGITTPQESIEFLFNWIENELPADYISIVDGETQRALVGQLDFTDTITPHVMVMQGKKSWQFGVITVKGNGAGNGNPTLALDAPGVIQAFTITHETLVYPLMLFDEWDDILARIAPSRLIGGNSLKYIVSAGLSEQVNNPNGLNIADEDSLLGNVGWYGENLNGGQNNYSIGNVVYKRLDDTINESLELTTQEQKLQFSVFNTEDNPFINGVSIVIPVMFFAPSDPSQYRDNTIAWSQTQEYNFIRDEIVEIVGSGGTASPRNYGTDIQSFKSCTATFISSSQIDFDVRVELAVEVVSRIGINEDQRYLASVEVANDLLSRDETDKVPLIIDAAEYFTDVSDPGLITIGNKFLTHQFSNIDLESESFVTVKPEDDLLSINDMVMDKNGREDDAINLSSAKGEVILRKTTGASFSLDSRSFVLNPELINDLVYGGIPKVDLNISRGFKTPADENRGNVKFFRQYGLDGGGLFYYRWQFPHIWRWEYYIKALGVSDEFFNPAEPEEGKNQDWFHYSDTLDWDLYYRATFTVIKNGNFIPYIREQKIDMLDYLASPDWINEEIKSFDENDVELVDGAEGFVNGDINGTIKAKFTWDGGALPVEDDIVGVLKIHIYEEGMYKSTYWISSAYDAHAATWWTSTDNSNRAVVTDLTAGVFEIKAILIGSKITPSASFSISARIYDKRGELPPVPPEIGILEEDGTNVLEEGGIEFSIEE